MGTRARAARSVAGLGLGLVVACGGGASGGNTSGGGSAGSAGASAAPTITGPCTRGVASADVDATIRIAGEMEASAHEMVVCGSLSFRIVVAVGEVLVKLAQDPGANALDSAYAYQDDGSYRTESTAVGKTTMNIRFLLPADGALGKKGDVVKPNLFISSSYLVGASSKVNLTTQKLELSFTGTGPLVELLGFGANPKSPISISTSALGSLGAELKKLMVSGDVHVDDAKPETTFVYDLGLAPKSVASVLSSGTLGYTMTGVSGSNASMGQTITVSKESWGISFVNHTPGALDGSFTMDVAGKHFPFRAVYAYPQSPTPTVTLSCL